MDQSSITRGADMELRQLQMFLTVAEELHFRRTSERLGIPQSTVSQAIQDLETELGGRLFHRTTRAVSLTEMGSTFLGDVRPAVAALRAASVHAREMAVSGKTTLRIGFMGGGIYELTQPFIAAVRQRFPRMELCFVEHDLRHVFDVLVSGEVDATFLRLPCAHPEIVSGPPVLSDQRMLLLPHHHRLAGEKVVHFDDIAGEPLVRLPLNLPEAWRLEHSPQRTPSGKIIADGPVAETVTEGLLAVAASRALHSVTRRFLAYYTHPEVAAVPMASPPIRTALAWRKHGAPKAMAEVCEILTEVAATARAGSTEAMLAPALNA
jgi:DNA-binding transcriptional LysR family regulator